MTRIHGWVPILADANYQLNPSELLAAICKLPFLIYTALNFALLLLLIYLSRQPAWGGRFAAVDVGVCAIFGGYTVLSTKAMASLLSTIFLQAFEYPITWGLVAVLAGTSVAQVKYLNKALMTFQSKVGWVLAVLTSRKSYPRNLFSSLLQVSERTVRTNDSDHWIWRAVPGIPRSAFVSFRQLCIRRMFPHRLG
jgi:hypothetical protein